MKISIVWITLLMFIYNALFAYMIIQFTGGQIRLLLLAFVALDYMLIFYLVLGVARSILSAQKMSSKPML
jgi:hypothetical protein